MLGKRMGSLCGVVVWIANAGTSQAGSSNTPRLISTVLTERSGAAEAILASSSPFDVFGHLLAWSMTLLAMYGACMGVAGRWRQLVGSALMFPLLFLATLIICFPVLHVATVLTDRHFSLIQTLNLVMMSIALNAILLACFAPIAGYFGLSSDYHFMKLLHVGICGTCGIYSSAVLQQALVSAQMGNGSHATGSGLFIIWAIVYGFVGTQVAWSLRPLIGEPSLPFQLLRNRNSNLSFYTAIWLSVTRLGHSPAQPAVAPSKESQVAI